MSASPPIADMCGATRDVRFGPKADMPHYSFDHFVGGDEQPRRYCKAKCFRGFQIDDSFVLGWHLRKIGRRGAAQANRRPDLTCPGHGVRVFL